MSHANHCPATGFTLRVPENWYELDLWRATRSRLLPRLVAERVAQLPALADHGPQLVRSLRRIAVDAENAGAVYCAAMAEPVDGKNSDDKNSDGKSFLLASCLVLRTAGPRVGLRTAGPRVGLRTAGPREGLRTAGPREGLRTAGPREGLRTAGLRDAAERSVEAIAAGFTATGSDAGPGRAREVRLLDLPAGRAVRVCESAFLGSGPAGTEHVVMHTLLPTPGWHEGGDGGVLDIVLSSPQVQLSGPMLDLFDAVTGTFRWLPSPEEP